MTFNDKGFQPLMTLNSALRAVLRALARCHSLLFTVILCSLNSLIRTPNNRTGALELFGCVQLCSGGAIRKQLCWLAFGDPSLLRLGSISRGINAQKAH